jgi:imidazolonepropionase-like amidohydrolase
MGMATAIINASLLTMTGSPIPDGYLVFAGDRITDVGAGMPAIDQLTACDQVLDAAGATLMPGLIDAHCHIGLFNDGLGREGEDGNEANDPLTPHLLAFDGVFSEDRCFAEALAAGVTTVLTGPGSANVLAGQFALLHTAGRRVEEMAVTPRAALKAALGENPKAVHGVRDRSPMTRMGTAALFREACLRARQYREKQQRAQAARAQGHDEPALPDLDLRAEALLPALSGALPVKFHVHRADDILTAVRLANEFGLRYTLDHCTEGYRIADLLAAEYSRGQMAGQGEGRPGAGRLEGVIVGPILSDRSKPELSRSDVRNAAILAQAGLPVAIMTDHPVVPIQYLAVSAAVAAQAGLPEDLALAAITSTAARLCGIGATRGQLAPGYAADLVLLSGHPFDFRSRIRSVWISGQTVFSGEHP